MDSIVPVLATHLKVGRPAAYGLPAVARELVKLSEGSYAVKHRYEPFIAPGFRDDDAPRELVEEMRASINVLSTRLLESEVSNA